MIYPTCGHPVADFDDVYCLTIGEYTCDEQGYRPCLSYRSFCKSCYLEAIEDLEYPALFGNQDEHDWLIGVHKLQK